jgi:phospholipase/carboxylesterase
MAKPHSRRTRSTTEGIIADEPAFQPGMPVRSYLPESYVHSYAYPLLVLFHGRGGNEERMLKLAPKVSNQNFVYLALRGPEMLGERKSTGEAAFGWDHENPDDMFGEYVRLSVQLARATYHIHSERIYLLGVREGAEAAYRAAFALGDKVAGVIALNGLMPTVEPGRPLFRARDVRQMKIFQAYGTLNPDVARADRDYRVLYGAGADIEYRRYESGRSLNTTMLSDVNTWLIGRVNAEHDLYVDRDED